MSRGDLPQPLLLDGPLPYLPFERATVLRFNRLPSALTYDPPDPPDRFVVPPPPAELLRPAHVLAGVTRLQAVVGFWAWALRRTVGTEGAFDAAPRLARNAHLDCNPKPPRSAPR